MKMAMLQKLPLEIITESVAVFCSFITGFYMSHSICAAEESHEIKYVGHTIGTFFYSDFLLPPTLAKLNGNREWKMEAGFGKTESF